MSNHSESSGDVEDNGRVELEPVPEDSAVADQASNTLSEPNENSSEDPGNDQNTESETEDTSVSSVEQLQQALQEAQEKSSEHWDLYTRSVAELENVKRRAEKDVQSAHKFALEKFSQDLLAVKDSLELGLSTEDADADKLREGTDLTLKMLSQVLEKFNIVEINPVGESFDPNHHQAMTMQPSNEYEPNTVIAVMQKGYLLNDRLLRPAMVIVSKVADA
jgi:molecular chaperone GrpE